MSSRNRECNRLYDFIEQITAIHLILYIHENARVVCEVIFSLSILSLTFGLNHMIYIPRPIHLWSASTGIGIAINHHRIWGIFIGCNPFVCTHNKPGQLGVMQPNGRKTIVDCARTCIGRWRRRLIHFQMVELQMRCVPFVACKCMVLVCVCLAVSRFYFSPDNFDLVEIKSDPLYKLLSGRQYLVI